MATNDPFEGKCSHSDLVTPSTYTIRRLEAACNRNPSNSDDAGVDRGNCADWTNAAEKLHNAAKFSANRKMNRETMALVYERNSPSWAERHTMLVAMLAEMQRRAAQTLTLTRHYNPVDNTDYFYQVLPENIEFHRDKACEFTENGVMRTKDTAVCKLWSRVPKASQRNSTKIEWWYMVNTGQLGRKGANCCLEPCTSALSPPHLPVRVLACSVYFCVFNLSGCAL